ncbi:MAG: response regulator transcription factor [Bacilli bacterium]
MAKILIADDELRMRRLIRDFLEREEHEILEAEHGAQALEMIQADSSIDLVVLDVMMPELSGWDVCKEVRTFSNVPILILTAKGEEYDEIYGLRIGADDYIQKPFKPLVLVARIEALLRRRNITEEKSVDESMLRFENIHVDINAHRVQVDGEFIELSPKEFDMLVYFMKNEGRVLTREKLLYEIWGYDYFGDARTVDTHINRLRMKLKAGEKYIITVRGVGYRFGKE